MEEEDQNESVETTEPEVKKKSGSRSDLKPIVGNGRNSQDDFDFSYIPGSLIDLLCKPGSDSDYFKSGGLNAGLVGKKKRKQDRDGGGGGGDGEGEGHDEDEDTSSEEEEYESGESGDTEEENPFVNRLVDSDESSGEDDRRRYLLGADSFLELNDPGLEGAFDSTDSDDVEEEEDEEEEEEIKRTKKRQERHEYKELCKSMGIHPNLRFLRQMHTDTVDLSRYGLKPEEIIAICKMMENNTYVTTFNISGNPAGFEGGKALASMLENNYTLRNVNLSGTGIKPAIELICKAVGHNVTLESLDLSANDLDDSAMTPVASMLKETTTVQYLNLSRNHIRDEGAKRLAAGVLQNRSLVSLDLAINEIKGEKPATPLVKALAEHPTLERIDLFNNSLKDGFAKGIAQILVKNKQLQYLNIAKNLFDAPGAKAMAGGLGKNAGLVEFIAGPNGWRHDGSEALLQPLLNAKAAPNLATLDFGWLHDVYTPYLKMEEKIKNQRPDLTIIRGHGFGQDQAKGPDKQELVIKRAKVVCENFATPLEMLIDELRKEPAQLTHKQFKKFIKSCNLYKNKNLTDSFIRNFPAPKLQVDCKQIIEVYDRIFPRRAKPLESTVVPAAAKPSIIPTNTRASVLSTIRFQL